jgi:hypothetical protein
MIEDVFVCVKNNHICKKIECTKFDDFVSANEYFKKNVDKSSMLFSTMIPVFSFLPSCLKEKYIQYEISKILCNINMNTK